MRFSKRCVGSTVATITLVVGVGSASAATLTSSVSKEGKTIIALNGEIAEGDSDTLKALIKTANDGGRLVSGLRLNSPGGSLLEGVKLADVIRYAKISTIVANGANCASACFIVFAAGSEKFVSYSASVGVHGASDTSGQESGDATVSMARIVKELGVSATIIGKMVVTPPDQVVSLTPDDLRSIGTTMTGKPAQVAPDTRTGPQLPLPLGPPATAVAPQTTPPKWDDLATRAVQLSTQQHNGNPSIHRGCQPELKVCTTAVLFKGNDGNDMMLRKAEDPEGKIISRELCSFNKFGDVRTCVDWDTGASHRDMKNNKGEWYKVGDQ